LQWLADHQERELLLRLTTAAGAFWSLRSNVEQRRRWFGTALQQAPEARPSLRLKALVALGELLGLHGEVAEARPILQEALTLARALDDARGVAQSLLYLSWCDARAGALDEAVAQIDAGLAAAQAAGDGWLAALAEMNRWEVARLQGQTRRALPWLEGAVRGFRTCGDAVNTAVALSVLGTATGEAGDYPRAVACYRECLEISLQLEDASLLNHACDAITLLCHGAGPAAQREQFRAAHPEPLSEHASPTIHRGRVRTVQLDLLGGGAVDGEVLAELLGALEALVRTRGLGRTPERARREQLFVELQGWMGAERFTTAWERGRACSYGEIVTLIRQVLDGLAAAPTDQPAVAANTADPLSPREHEVLQLLAAGLSNRAIAAQLTVAERTAKHHLTSLFNKLGASSRTQALAVARQRGLL
jgi:ATP/maltotriose-dependent transcriptional regulator MalT